MPPDPRIVRRDDEIPPVLQEELRRSRRGPGTPPVLQEELRKAAQRRKADEEIGRKWTSLGGCPGRSNG